MGMSPFGKWIMKPSVCELISNYEWRLQSPQKKVIFRWKQWPLLQIVGSIGHSMHIGAVRLSFIIPV